MQGKWWAAGTLRASTVGQVFKWTPLAKSLLLSKDMNFIVCNVCDYIPPTSCHLVTIKSEEIYSSLYKRSHESICLFSVVCTKQQACQSSFLLLPVFLKPRPSPPLPTQLSSHSNLGFQACSVLSYRGRWRQSGIWDCPRAQIFPEHPRFWCLLLFQEALGTLLMGEKGGRWFALSFEHHFSRKRCAAIQRGNAWLDAKSFWKYSPLISWTKL